MSSTVPPRNTLEMGPIEHWALRLLRILALGALAVCLIPLFSIIIYSLLDDWLSTAYSAVQVGSRNLAKLDSGERIGLGGNTLKLILMAFVPLLLPAVLLMGAWWLRLRSWGWILCGSLFVGGFGFYLLKDEPLNQRVLLEEFAPSFVGAESSYAVLMRYSSKKPSPEARAFFVSPLANGWNGMSVSNRLEWTKKLLLQRPEFEQAWKDLAPQRRWLAEINSFDRIGDLSKSGDEGTIGVSQIRTLVQCTAAMASIQALDGDGDTAIATLLPMLQLVQNLRPFSRNYDRTLTAYMVESYMLDALGFVLDLAPVSPGMRQRVAALLPEESYDDIAAASRLVMLDYAQFCSHAKNKAAGDLIAIPVLNYLSPLLYQPHRTLNLFRSRILQLQMEARLPTTANYRERKMKIIEDDLQDALSLHDFRNLIGNLTLRRWAEPYSKHVSLYWRIVKTERPAVRAKLPPK
jgi:hypothetical protein